jgi:hypothetical protein
MMTSEFSQWPGGRYGCHEAVGEVYTDGVIPNNLKQRVRNSAVVRGLYYGSLADAWKKADQIVEKMALLSFNAGILSHEITNSKDLAALKGLKMDMMGASRVIVKKIVDTEETGDAKIAEWTKEMQNLQKEANAMPDSIEKVKKLVKGALMLNLVKCANDRAFDIWNAEDDRRAANEKFEEEKARRESLRRSSNKWDRLRVSYTSR